jgi:hypothetical protein
MIEHPCENGLSKSCFAAYPDWVRQALAYKFLQVILPQQVMPLLKSGLDLPFIGPGATLPSGVELPPGSIIPPDLEVPENWIPWFNMIFITDEDPRRLFPMDWKLGDSIPRGIRFPKDYILPSNWTPNDPPHPVYLPGYNPFPRPEEWTAALPLFISTFEPGPVHRSSPTPPVGWSTIFTNAYWELWYIPFNGGDTMAWDGTQWQAIYGGATECVSWPALNPKTGTTWSVGYRPAQARITFTGGTGPIKIGLCDTGGNVLGHNLACVSPQIIDLTFTAGLDIKRLNTPNIGMYITNIEFK